MELHLVVPVNNGAQSSGDERLNGKWWRVKGPMNIEHQEQMKYHCVSYVWGSRRESIGGFFNCKIEISDQTRPALEASMRAADALHDSGEVPPTPAFWIDALCIPQDEGPARYGSLESMGWIYSAATSVIIVLQEAAWKVINMIASSINSPDALSYEEMEILEAEKWVSSVWTYQEIVNCNDIFFTTASPEGHGKVVPAEPFFNGIGFSLEQWKRKTRHPASQTLSRFPNLNTLEDTLADRQIVGYLDFPALSILSNIAMRRFDPEFPKNRILASLGALHKAVSWGKPSATLDELADKFMAICEARGDYSFIFTSDIRSDDPGLRWRPRTITGESKPTKKPIHLVPIVSFYSWTEPFGETQKGRTEADGYWLDQMVPLSPATSMNGKAREKLDLWLYGTEIPIAPAVSNNIGFFEWDDKERYDIRLSMFRALTMIGFTGSNVAQVCESGLFFSQFPFLGKADVEFFATVSIRWMFGSPGLVRWKEGDGFKYSAGVFAGHVNKDHARALFLN